MKKSKGYSLIEAIVYLAIFGTLSVLVINSFIVVLNSFNRSRINSNLAESGASAIERMSREIRQAKNIDTTNSVLNSSFGTLQLNSTDSSNVAKIEKFNVSNGDLNLYENDVLIGNLLGQKVDITSFIVRRITTVEGEAVKIEMTLQNTGSTTITTVNFYNTIILRGSY